MVYVRDWVSVTPISVAGSDAGIVQAARVSLLHDDPPNFESDETGARDRGLINYLMREKHGTPFEHNSITFRAEAPIFVFREWHRHRIQSYNEQSARYTEMTPNFYIPSIERPLVNSGTSAKPVYDKKPTEDEWQFMETAVYESYQDSWGTYQRLLERGIAPEVARIVLPVGIISRMYATANLRAWMNFLSLRTHVEGAVHVSRPQREIEMCAELIEEHLTQFFPIAMKAYNANGRVAP